MSPSPPGQRNRALLDALLSTRPPHPDNGALIALADTLEAQGYLFSGWTIDGPGVQVRFHGTENTVAGSLLELRAAARGLAAGDSTAWHALVLQDGASRGPTPPPSSESFP